MFLKRLTGVLIATCALSAGATELVRLPIRSIQQIQKDQAVQILVTVDFDSCRYVYKGLYVEPVAEGQGQIHFEVRALASKHAPSEPCNTAVEPRTDSLSIPVTSSDRYEFLAVQPK
jgi:hypothetical protein